MSETTKCELCGEPMPPGEEMFRYHGYSGPCPAPPPPNRQPVRQTALMVIREPYSGPEFIGLDEEAGECHATFAMYELRDGEEIVSSTALAAARAEVETLKRHAVLREIDCANEMARANAAEEERDRMAEEVGQLTADLAAVRKVEEWEGLRGTRIKWVEAPREQQSEWRAWSWGLRATANPRIVATGDSIIALGRALAAQEGTDAT